MKNFVVLSLLATIGSLGHALKCYECNVYASNKPNYTGCMIQTCPKEYNLCTVRTYTSKTTVEEINFTDCYYEHDNGTSYRGSRNITTDGSACVAWDANINFTYNSWLHRDRGLGEHNYCRNPDGDTQPWCYINTASDYMYCGVHKCQPHITDVVERSCGWLHKNFCKINPTFVECYVTCETDLCNKPPNAPGGSAAKATAIQLMTFLSALFTLASYYVMH